MRVYDNLAGELAYRIANTMTNSKDLPEELVKFDYASMTRVSYYIHAVEAATLLIRREK